MADPVLKFPPEQKTSPEAKPRIKIAAEPRRRLMAGMRRYRRFLLLVVLPIAAVIAGLVFYLNGGRYVTTDDAYVGAQKVLITPDISGKIDKVVVKEGQHVNEGGVLFMIDPEPFRLAVDQAKAQLEQAKTTYDNLVANIKIYGQMLDLAQRNLDHTVMRAPMAGVATQVEQIQLGRFIAAGTPVFSIIDVANPWVDANPKESDFTYVAVGQPVTLDVDAFPNHVFKGYVGSLSPGTGAQFAILPPQNATGNFVKVVQRVPVRIYFDKNDKFVGKLKAGMSVYATIDTGHRRSLAALLGLSPAAANQD